MRLWGTMILDNVLCAVRGDYKASVASAPPPPVHPLFFARVASYRKIVKPRHELVFDSYKIVELSTMPRKNLGAILRVLCNKVPDLDVIAIYMRI